MWLKFKYYYFFVLIFSVNLTAYPQETVQKYLSGTGAENTVNWDFFCSAGQRSGVWTTIAVPSCWEQQGFGAYNYGHDPLKKRLNETGTYRYRFRVPANWKQLETQIVFEGVMTDAEVKINGRPAGPVHQGAFYEFRYDISRMLHFGRENELEVRVKKHSDNASVNEAERTADFWVFGGIFRPVYLEAKPKVNIQRVAVDAKADGSFTSDVYLTGFRNAASIQVRLEPLFINGSKAETLPATPVTGSVTRITSKAAQVLAWTPETPYRYRAVFDLLDRGGELLHRYTETIGFRTVEVREADGIYVNGTRVKLKGVNRHTFNPTYGRTSSKTLSILDVNTIKDMNMNAVRMAHYPPEKHFLDVCDSLGLFVLDELTGWQKPPYDDIIGLKLVKEMITRDVNHPSIILWDNGNEGGGNYNLDNVFEQLDIQKREVLHPWEEFKKINTAHYIPYNYLAHDNHSRRKILLPTEFLHGLYDGGAGAGLDDYWRKMWEDPLCAGGFIWNYADESIARTDKKDSLDSDGNHGPDGILGPYLEKEGSYYAIKEIWSPIFFEKRYVTPEFDGKFNIENRYDFTNLDQCRIEVAWLDFPGPGERSKVTEEHAERLRLSVEPGRKAVLQVSLPKGWKRYDALVLTATDPSGRLINKWVWPVKKAQQNVAEILPKKHCGNPELSDTSDNWLITVGTLKLSFNKKTGLLSQVRRDSTIIPLSNGPVLIGRDQVLKNVICYKRQDAVYLVALYESGNNFNWVVGPDGLVRLTVNYEPKNNNLFAGISFDFPENQVTGMRWLGQGPYRVYKNRMKGTSFGLWEKAYNNTITGESGYLYPEFKGYHAGTYRAEIGAGKDQGFAVYIASDDIFLRMFTPGIPKSPANTLIEYPPGDISFLHTINAIGTKFDAMQGPQAALNAFNANKLYGRMLQLKLIFDFKSIAHEQ